MHVRMVHQVLAPGVQHRQEAEAGSQVFGVGGDVRQRLRHGLKQQTVHDARVLQRERTETFR